MDWAKKFKEINNKKFSIPGYNFDNNIFRGAIFLIFIVLIVASFQIKDKAYFKCDNKTIGTCENPFYLASPCPFRDVSLCGYKEVFPGISFGEKPGPFYHLAGPTVFLILALALLSNHLINNKSWGSP